MTRRSPALAGAFLLLGGCATTQLTPYGSRVFLVPTAPPDVLTNYTALGTIACSRGESQLVPRSVRTNVLQCQNDIRNETAARGGQIVVITSQQLGNQSCWWCVTIVATAYRRTAVNP
jgi:hypothetical protein